MMLVGGVALPHHAHGWGRPPAREAQHNQKWQQPRGIYCPDACHVSRLSDPLPCCRSFSFSVKVFQRREADEVRFTQINTEMAAMERRVIVQVTISAPSKCGLEEEASAIPVAPFVCSSLSPIPISFLPPPPLPTPPSILVLNGGKLGRGIHKSAFFEIDGMHIDGDADGHYGTVGGAAVSGGNLVNVQRTIVIFSCAQVPCKELSYQPSKNTFHLAQPGHSIGIQMWKDVFLMIATLSSIRPYSKIQSSPI